MYIVHRFSFQIYFQICSKKHELHIVKKLLLGKIYAYADMNLFMHWMNKCSLFM